MTLCDSMSAGSAPAVRILLVDDHLDTLVMLSRLLAKAGYHVTTAASFAAAIAESRHATFDVLVTDIELRDGTGWALFESLRRATPSLRAIAISGHAMPWHLNKSHAAGFEAHLVKPLDLKRLCETISRAATRPLPPPELPRLDSV